MGIASLLLALQVSLAAPSFTAAQDPPVVETRFGIRTVDEDRWLEDLKSPNVRAWAKTQNDYTRRMLDSIPGRAKVLAEIQRLDSATASEAQNVRWLADGRLLVLRKPSGEQIGKLFLRSGLEGTEALLVDPEDWRRRTGKPHNVSYFRASPDGRKLAVGIAEAGSEEAVLHLFDLATMKPLEPELSRAPFGMHWLPDSSGFIYSRLNEMKPGTPITDRKRDVQAYRHRIGEPHAQDPVIFGNRYGTGLGIQSNEIARVSVTPGSDWLLANPGTTGNQRTLFAAPIADLTKPRIGWRKVVTPNDNVRDYAVHGDDLYVLRSNSPNRSIDRLQLSSDGGFQPFVAPADGPITGLSIAKDALFYASVPPNGVGKRLHRRAWGTDESTLVLPSVDTVYVNAEPYRSGGLVLSTGWSKFFQIHRLDDHGTLTQTDLQPVREGLDADAFESKVVDATSHDGELVPLSIVTPRGQRRDSRTPFLLAGYGAYGSVSTPGLGPSDLAYATFGIGFAICHVRGGGEKGEAWYRAGFQATKANSWKDFIACADYLIQHGYTSTATLAAFGASAGGLLVGNAVVERPDLFAVAFPDIAVLDAVGMAQRDPNGPANWAEFGDPATEAGYTSVVGMSAYHKLKPGTAYPATMLVVGFNDTRVAAWNPFKFAARLQRASNSGKPALLRIDFDAGHMTDDATLAALQAQQADRFTFMLWQMGVPGFQPAPPLPTDPGSPVVTGAALDSRPDSP